MQLCHVYIRFLLRNPCIQPWTIDTLLSCRGVLQVSEYSKCGTLLGYASVTGSDVNMS